MAKGFIQQNNNTQQSFGKGLQQPVQQQVVQQPRPQLNQRKKDINQAQRSQDFSRIDGNNLLKAIYEERHKALLSYQNIDILDDYDERLKYTENLLKCSLSAFQHGMHPQMITSALSPYMVLSCVNTTVHNDIPLELYDKLESIASRLILDNAMYKDYYNKCKSGELPYNPETAALAEIAMDLKFYKDYRATTDPAEQKKIDSIFHENIDKLHSKFKTDGVSKDDMLERNHSIVAPIVKTDIVMKKSFEFVYDNHAINFDAMEQSYATIVDAMGKPHTSSVYRIPMGGLTYLDGGGTFPYRIGPRMPFSPNIYDDKIYEIMKTHYGKAHKAYKPDATYEDKLYLKNSEYLQALSKAYEYRALMIDDGYSQESIDNLLKAVEKRCEMYYHTETEEGIEEWLTAHPEDAYKFENPEPVKAKKHIKIKRNDENTKSKDEWIIAPSDAAYVPTVEIQHGYELTRPFYETMVQSDYDNMAEFMNELAYSVEPQQTKYLPTTTVTLLLTSPDSTVNEFLDYFKSKDLNESQRRAYDLIMAMTKTEAPVIDKSGRLVATRAINGLISAGDEGGKIHGKCKVAPGCWVDTKSGITNTELTGNVAILMRSSIKNSTISGTGLIVNSDIENCKLSGTFNEYELRVTMGLEHKSPVHLLTMKGETKKFDSSKESDMNRIESHGSEYRDRTVEEYVTIWQSKTHARNVLRKMGLGSQNKTQHSISENKSNSTKLL